MPRVSVIILTHNRAALLPQAIESVLAQTYKDIELIVVDDASTDATPQVLAGYGDRIKVVRRDVNGGEAKTRNTGLQHATGECISFLDDDDYYEPQKIEKELALLDRHPEAGIAYCRFYYMNAAGQRQDASSILPEGDVFKDMLQGFFVLSHAPLTRREWFDRIDGFDTTLPMSIDWDAWLRISMAGCQFVCVQEPLVGYRMHSSSMSTGIARWQKANILVLDRIFSNPALSDDVKAVHDRAYGLSRLYVAIAYYRFGLWDEAQAMMREAFQWQPMWSAHPLEVVNALCIAAFDLRVADPVSFIEGVFAHLPAEAMSLMDHQQRACATIFIEAGLRAVAGAEHSKAIAHFATAKPLCTPSEFNKIFIQRTRELALVLPVTSPSAFVEQAFETAHENHLPASLRRQVLAEVNIASAFENYTSGHFNQVQSQVIKAIANKPNLALNRGVLKILLKSLTPLEK